MTLELLIKEIEKRIDDAPYNNSTYRTGYYDALIELLEFIKDNK